ncbi:MAG: DUF4097 domain-containing protein [Pyrinomonadaceae bacterium]
MVFRLIIAFLCVIACAPMATRVAAHNQNGFHDMSAAVMRQQHNQADEEFSSKEEIRRSFQLSPGARVEVSGISGPVEIETSNSETAEVYIVRSARQRVDLEYRKIVIEQTPTSLSVRNERTGEAREGRGVQIRERATLKLPRRIELSVSGISGTTKIGDVDGRMRASGISGGVRIGDVGGDFRASGISGSLTVGEVGGVVQLEGISGGVKVGRTTGHLEARGISGSITTTIARFDERGIRLSSISGGINLRFTEDINADFAIDNFSGSVSLDVPNVIVQSRAESSNMRARIGAGGAHISISNVSGGVRLTR